MQENTAVNSAKKRYCTRAMAFAIAVGIFFLILGRKDICRGYVLGAVFSVLNFVLISQSLHTRIEGKTKNGASLPVLINMGIRYISMALPLFVAIKLDRFNVYGTFGGLLAVQLAILIDHLNKAFLPSKYHL